MPGEVIASNYMEALLRAALILGERGREPRVDEIRISSFCMQGAQRQLQPRCKITVEAGAVPNAMPARLLILYPEAGKPSI